MCVIELNVIETNTLINLQDNFKFYKNIWNIMVSGDIWSAVGSTWFWESKTQVVVMMKMLVLSFWAIMTMVSNTDLYHPTQ